jgi:hypothetical protein
MKSSTAMVVLFASLAVAKDAQRWQNDHTWDYTTVRTIYLSNPEATDAAWEVEKISISWDPDSNESTLEGEDKASEDSESEHEHRIPPTEQDPGGASIRPQFPHRGKLPR